MSRLINGLAGLGLAVVCSLACGQDNAKWAEREDFVSDASYLLAVHQPTAIDRTPEGMAGAARKFIDSLDDSLRARAALPLDDDSVDHVLCTWTLCTIPDAAAALGEMRRVLRPGGVLHFVEHGRAPDADVAKWQRRLTPIQRRIAGGCHLDRPIAALIGGAGFAISDLHTYFGKGPKSFSYFYEGLAVPGPSPARG